jgi:hypothetical protein
MGGEQTNSEHRQNVIDAAQRMHETLGETTGIAQPDMC